MNKLSLFYALAAIFLTGIIIFLERLFPFALFSRKNPPKILKYIEQFIPPMAIAALLIYSLKDISFTQANAFLPQLIALAVTVILHLIKKNSMLSIFGGTIIYMVLIRLI